MKVRTKKVDVDGQISLQLVAIPIPSGEGQNVDPDVFDAIYALEY